MSDEIDELFARQPSDAIEVSLTTADVEVFERDGFVSIGRITTDEELAWLGELYDWLFAGKAEAFRGGRFDLVRPYDSEGEDRLPQLLTPEQRFPQLRQTVFWRNGRKLAAQLMGLDEGVLRGWGHMIRKPALVGDALPWHQDEAYWDPAMVYRALGCWLPLDDATIENGCMSYVPGSHRREVLAHRHVGSDPRVHALFHHAREGGHRAGRTRSRACGRSGVPSQPHAALVGSWTAPKRHAAPTPTSGNWRW